MGGHATGRRRRTARSRDIHPKRRFAPVCSASLGRHGTTPLTRRRRCPILQSPGFICGCRFCSAMLVLPPPAALASLPLVAVCCPGLVMCTLLPFSGLLRPLFRSYSGLFLVRGNDASCSSSVIVFSTRPRTVAMRSTWSLHLRRRRIRAAVMGKDTGQRMAMVRASDGEKKKNESKHTYAESHQFEKRPGPGHPKLKNSVALKRCLRPAPLAHFGLAPVPGQMLVELSDICLSLA